MKAYKGFNENMECKGFKYREGVTYTTEYAKICKCGFHACLDPFDCFYYYTPLRCSYHVVELFETEQREDDEDTKVCAKGIKIGKRLGINDMIEEHVRYISLSSKDAVKWGPGRGEIIDDQYMGKTVISGDQSDLTVTCGEVRLICGSKSKIHAKECIMESITIRSGSIEAENCMLAAAGNDSQIHVDSADTILGGDRMNIRSKNDSYIVCGKDSTVETGPLSYVRIGEGTEVKCGEKSSILYEDANGCIVEKYVGGMSQILPDTWYMLVYGELVKKEM